MSDSIINNERKNAVNDSTAAIVDLVYWITGDKPKHNAGVFEAILEVRTRYRTMSAQLELLRGAIAGGADMKTEGSRLLKATESHE